ncbi:MAG TPA: hypothetical protein DD979_10010 [Gammaproteobacteria bacterium]|nr:hypothetical protein [Gammaproteobacteria bacterium]
MTAARDGRCAAHRQRGLSYVEVVVAVALLAVALVPVLDGLQMGVQSASVNGDVVQQQTALQTRLRSIQAEPFAALVAAAQAAGGANNPSTYSDPTSQADRIVVYLSAYDPDNDDGDGDMFTVADPNGDGDNNPYTSADTDPELALIWAQVVLENSPLALHTLVRR